MIETLILMTLRCSAIIGWSRIYVGWPDFNNDKKVDFKDFALLAANWQQSIPPP